MVVIGKRSIDVSLNYFEKASLRKAPYFLV